MYTVTTRVSDGRNHPTSVTFSCQEHADDTTHVHTTLYVSSYIFLNLASTLIYTVQANAKNNS
jgi:hypothetical protein